ncbi:MAG: tRNA pseudouridine(55) synthase TruB, partial [Gammaproteobacteria bacterium]|nr:tRNA pseudouridine(55) synthase TruB [Gammaproteobacteria bacterium]
MTRKNTREAVEGILLLDKPLGMTSNQALQEAKRILNARKAGHTGSLDPIATGLLPLCFGESTKISRFLLESGKRYRTTFRLGQATSTGDAEGEVISERPVDLQRDAIVEALESFRGRFEQVPPMYSALKRNGQPLYKLARQGIEVEREPRAVEVYELRLVGFDPAAASVELELECSRGFYVR